MVNWFYHVQVTTEADSSLKKAISELRTIQGVTADAFQDFNNFVHGDEFSNTILDNLSSQISKFKDENVKVQFEGQLDPIIKGIDEIRLAVYTLLDAKTGSFFKTIATLEKTEENLGSVESKESFKAMKNLIEEEFKTFAKDTKDSADKMWEDIFNDYKSKSPQLLDSISDTYLDLLTEGDVFTDKSKNRKIGNINQYVDNPNKVITDAVVNDLQNLLKDFSPAQFQKILKDQPNINAYETLTKAIETIVDTRQEMKGFPKSTHHFSNYVKAEREIDKAKETLDTVPLWTSLKGNIADAIKEMIKGSESELLKDENVLNLIDKNFFTKLIETIQDNIFHLVIDEKKDYKPTIFSNLKKTLKNKPDLLDTEKMGENLNERGIKIDDLFTNIQKSVDEVHAKLYEEERLEDFENELVNELLKSFKPEFVEPVTKAITELMEKGDVGFEKQFFEEWVNKIDPSKLPELFESFTNQFINVGIKNEDLNAEAKKRNDRETEGTKAFEQKIGMTAATIDFDFDKYFLEAKWHRLDLWREIRDGINNVFFEILNSEGRLGHSLLQIDHSIKELDIPTPTELPSGTVSHIVKGAPKGFKGFARDV